MIRLETLIELKFLNSSSSSFLLLKLDTQLLVEQFEATASQSTVPSPPLNRGTDMPERQPTFIRTFTYNSTNFIDKLNHWIEHVWPEFIFMYLFLLLFMFIYYFLFSFSFFFWTENSSEHSGDRGCRGLRQARAPQAADPAMIYIYIYML